VTRVRELDLGDLALDRGAHLLVKRALRDVEPGAPLRVAGRAKDLVETLRAYCRGQGHTVVEAAAGVAVVVRGPARGRLAGADVTSPSEVVERPPARWGLAARGAIVEAGALAFDFPLREKAVVWSDDAARLYALAAAAQWDPATAIPWDTPFVLDDDVEDAVVQVMTYLIENETAALVVPARLASQLHPHFREVLQLLAVQAADEARHIEVFTRRALLKRTGLGLSTVGGQTSLKTLVDEQDFALAGLLLSVLGEGSFLSLLAFLRDHAPDPVTRAVAQLSGQDEARHVAFGLSHLERHLRHDPSLKGRLAAAIRARHDTLAATAGLNEEVFDALVLLAAGSWEPAALERGWDAVVALTLDMDTGRRMRLGRLGFGEREAEELSALHTRNFM
jgi:hypothetical protein